MRRGEPMRVRRCLLLRVLAIAAAGAALATAAHAGSTAVNAGAACSGNFGLRITAGSICLLDTENTVSGPVSGTHGACAHLFAESATTSGVTTFVAGHRIALGEDFIAGNDFSAEISPSLSPLAFVGDDSPAGELTYRASFEVDLTSLTLDGSDLIRHLVGLSRDGKRWLQVLFQPSIFPAGENRLRLQALEDDGSSVSTPFGQQLLVPDGCNTIAIDWVAAPGAGRLLVSLNGGSFTGLTGLTNGGGRIDRVEWGAAGGALQSLTGSFAQDEYASTR